MGSRFDSSALCAGAAVLLSVAFTLALLAGSDSGLSGFVVAGDRFADPRAVPENLAVAADSAGYDGQFYYRLALNPFTRDRGEFGIRFDYPVYRHQRILYPFLAWLLAAGRPAAIPFTLVAVNWIAMGMIGWASAKIAQLFGQHALWSAAVWLFPGFLLSLARDCVEIVEIACLAVGVILLVQRKLGWAAVAFSAAALAKESAILVAAGLAAGFFLSEREPSRWRYLHIVFWPLAVHATFKLALFWWWSAPFSLGTGVLTAPFAGLAARPWRGFEAFELLLLALMVLPAIFGLMRNPLSRRFALAWVPSLALLVSLDQRVWIEDWSFLRAAAEYWTLAAVIAMGTRGWPQIAAALIASTGWLAVAAHVLSL